MRELERNVWIHEQAWMGLTHALRTTVVRMADGSLWVHSPTPLDDSLRREVDGLGAVRYLVAANNHHHRWLQQWHDAFPDAAVFVSPGIPKKKRPALRTYRLLAHDGEAPWAAELEQAFMGGVPFFDETVFFHGSTGSLIVTDFVQNHTDPVPTSVLAMLAAPLFARLGYADVCLAPPLRVSWLRRDPAAFRRFLAKVMAWPVRRIIVTHGRVVQDRAHERLCELCTDLAKSP